MARRGVGLPPCEISNGRYFKNVLSVDSYKNRPAYFKKINRSMWSNWLWQQQNAINNLQKIIGIFPAFPKKRLKHIENWVRKGFRFLITPYVLSLVNRDSAGNPETSDPLWKQVFPIFNAQNLNTPDEYSTKNENWENPKEMITPIAQHKYDNRVIIYLADICLGYCIYCFRSLQSNNVKEKHGGIIYWKQTLEALNKLQQVEEVILSGGDPLVFDNVKFDRVLADLRQIKHVKAIRIHTRAWTHNPYRIDEAFCRLLKQYEVTEMGVHVVHPRELTLDFQAAVGRVRSSGARTLLLTDTPLIKGINDDKEVLHRLFMELYTSGIKPYYLSHNMPNIPGAAFQRTSVQKGLRLYNSLKRRISNTAMPEYIICHKSGKKTVPESPKGAADFIYTRNRNNWPIVKFKDWKGRWQIYVDGLDK